jgi:hypothetical protein
MRVALASGRLARLLADLHVHHNRWIGALSAVRTPIVPYTRLRLGLHGRRRRAAPDGT